MGRRKQAPPACREEEWGPVKKEWVEDEEEEEFEFEEQGLKGSKKETKLQLMARDYVFQTDVIFPSNFSPLSTQHLFKKTSRRRHPMVLNGNQEHFGLVRYVDPDRGPQKDIAFCYAPRLKKVRRPLGHLKANLPGFERTKLTSTEDMEDPAFAPFVSYLPPFVVEGSSLQIIKSNKESFAAFMIIMVKEVTDEKTMPPMIIPRKTIKFSTSPSSSPFFPLPIEEQDTEETETEGEEEARYTEEVVPESSSSSAYIQSENYRPHLYNPYLVDPTWGLQVGGLRESTRSKW